MVGLRVDFVAFFGGFRGAGAGGGVGLLIKPGGALLTRF